MRLLFRHRLPNASNLCEYMALSYISSLIVFSSIGHRAVARRFHTVHKQVAEGSPDHPAGDILSHKGVPGRRGGSNDMKLALAWAAAAYRGPGHPRSLVPRVNPPRYRLANDGAVA